MCVMYLVMAVCAQGKKPTPLRVFNDRSQAEKWQAEVIDHHVSPPEIPDVDDSDGWKEYDLKVSAWRNSHPAGIDASQFNSFAIYEVPVA